MPSRDFFLAHNTCSRPLDWLAVVRLVIKCGQLKPRHVSLPLDRVTKDKTNTVPPPGPLPSLPHQSAHIEPPKDRHRIGEPYVCYQLSSPFSFVEHRNIVTIVAIVDGL